MKKSCGNLARKNKNRNKEDEINGLLRVYVTSTRLLLLALYWYSTIYIQSSANKHGNLPFSFDGLSHLVVSWEFTIAVWRNCCIKYHHHLSTVTRQNGVSKEVCFSACASFKYKCSWKTHCLGTASEIQVSLFLMPCSPFFRWIMYRITVSDVSLYNKYKLT